MAMNILYLMMKLMVGMMYHVLFCTVVCSMFSIAYEGPIVLLLA